MKSFSVPIFAWLPSTTKVFMNLKIEDQEYIKTKVTP